MGRFSGGNIDGCDVVDPGFVEGETAEVAGDGPPAGGVLPLPPILPFIAGWKLNDAWRCRISSVHLRMAALSGWPPA